MWWRSSSRYQARSCTGSPAVTISQSRTAATCWSAPKIMLPMRESPQHSAGRRAGRRHARLEQLEGPVDRPGTGRRRTRRSRYSRSSSSCSAGRDGGDPAEPDGVAVEAVDGRHRVEAALPHASLAGLVERRHPALAVVAGVVGRHLALDAGHAHEPGAEHVGALLEPQHLAAPARCPRRASACITSTWASKAVLGKTVCPVGSTRMTSGWTSPSQVASKSSVSLENPDRPGIATSPTSTWSAPVWRWSHAARAARVATGSRSVDTAMAALPPACVELEPVLVHVVLVQRVRSDAKSTTTKHPTASAGPNGKAPRSLVTARIDETEHHADDAAEHQGVQHEPHRTGDRVVRRPTRASRGRGPSRAPASRRRTPCPPGTRGG